MAGILFPDSYGRVRLAHIIFVIITARHITSDIDFEPDCYAFVFIPGSGINVRYPDFCYIARVPSRARIAVGRECEYHAGIRVCA